MRSALKYTGRFVLLIVGFVLFGLVSFLVPDKAVREHIAASAPQLVAETNYPRAIMDLKQCEMDNFTDALIMSQVYNMDRQRPLWSVMSMVRTADFDPDQPGALLKTVQGVPQEPRPYPRYWHGSTFLYRWMLAFMEINSIRFTLFLLSSLLLLACCGLLLRHLGWLRTLFFAFAFVMVYGYVMQFSMQFFPVLAIALVGVMLTVHGTAKGKDLRWLFFLLGAITCYFDLLTVPLLTLGLPLAVWLAMKEDAPVSLWEGLKQLVMLSLLWGLGFALSFGAKWGLATLLTGEDVFTDAYGASMYRMEADDFTRWDAVSFNYEMINTSLVWVVAGVVLLYAVIQSIRKPGVAKVWLKRPLFLLIVLMPYVWYLLLANHSYLHWWFTYRLQAVAILGLLLAIAPASSAPRWSRHSDIP